VVVGGGGGGWGWGVGVGGGGGGGGGVLGGDVGGGVRACVSCYAVLHLCSRVTWLWV
jgi:hypothetical protein